MRINYKSDFDFILDLENENGPVGWPEWNWRLVIKSKEPGAVKYIASYIDGVPRNCFNDNGRIHVVCAGHGFRPCHLCADFHSVLGNSVYPNGKQTVVQHFPLNIELVREEADNDPTKIEIQNTIPVVYITAYDIAVRAGYDGTLEDYISATERLPRLAEDAEGRLTAWEAAESDRASEFSSLGTQSRNATREAEDAAEAARDVTAALQEMMPGLARTDRNNNFTAGQTVNGNLTVLGDIVQNGSGYVTEAEHVKTRTAYVTVREGAVGGLGVDERAGIEVKLYDGENDGVIEVGPDGVARVGDRGDAQPLLTRVESDNLKDGDLLMWDAVNRRAVPLECDLVNMTATYEDDSTETFQVLCKHIDSNQ